MRKNIEKETILTGLNKDGCLTFSIDSVYTLLSFVCVS